MNTPIGKRRAARELALKLLFQIDVGRIPVTDVLELFETDEEIGEAPPEAVSYAHELVRGTSSNLKPIDHLLASMTEEWAYDRLANVDRNILRLAVYELGAENSVPEEIVINEAVDLAKEYSTPESGKFVNGVLGNVSRQRAAGAILTQPFAPGGPQAAPVAAPTAIQPDLIPEPAATPDRPSRRRQPLRMDV